MRPAREVSSVLEGKVQEKVKVQKHLQEQNDTNVFVSKQTKTELPDRRSVVLDIGSMVNVVGSNTLTEFERTMAPYDLQPSYEDRPTPFRLSGVGSGSSLCTKEVTIAVAVQFEDKQPQLETFHANVATGSGADLPAIIGKKSLSDKDGVILLREGKEQLIVPGPGGYKIQWSPGTRIMSLEQVPSGHIAFVCDRYDQMPKGRSVDQISLVTDHKRQE